MAQDAKKKHANDTRIIKCTCKHKDQDKIYDLGQRVHNSCGDGYRCTVCQDVKKY